MTTETRIRTSEWGALALFLALCLGVGAIGSLATTPNIDPWYNQLEKPAWTPPGWLFGPVWTLLYLTMAVAAWEVWRERHRVDVRVALAAFFVQLALNLAWSFIFFGAHAIGWAALQIVALWVAIGWTIVAFRSISVLAVWLLAPYLAWVSFAAAINLTIWRLAAA